MRLRKRYKRNDPTVLTDSQDDSSVKVAKPVKAKNTAPRFLRNIINNPNFSYQAMVILMTLTSDSVPMDRRIDTMSTTVEKVRNVSEMITNTMQSLKNAAETPKKIRSLLK